LCFGENSGDENMGTEDSCHRARPGVFSRLCSAFLLIWLQHGGLLLLAVGLLHGGGFACGYLLARLLGCERIIRQTISIEVGMQNSGLAVVLARQNFADPLTAAPGAVSSVIHPVIGSMLAGYWR